jgi:hypothetical protein
MRGSIERAIGWTGVRGDIDLCPVHDGLSSRANGIGLAFVVWEVAHA